MSKAKKPETGQGCVMGARDAMLPPGRYVDLPGRGTTFVRELDGPAGAPTLLLLHGWTTNADLGWGAVYPELAGRFRIIAPDHRGHGRGIRGGEPFKLGDCADDAAALLEALEVERAVVVGYSMGGSIAQLVWRRHPHLVEGLVLCATSQTFNGTPRDRALFGLLSGASATARRMTEDRRSQLAMRLMARRHVDPEAWAWAAETIVNHDWLAIIDAGRELGRFDSRAWARRIDVPTAVVVTTHDHVVPPVRQHELAAAIPGATIHRVHGDHAACLVQADLLVPAMLDAISSVRRRAATPVLAAVEAPTAAA
jgi:pimeloyl-ACP methyl ester carboxylesterase